LAPELASDRKIFESPAQQQMEPEGDITRLLRAWEAGDPDALRQLMSLVYAELHQLAGRQLARERAGHTLQTTALVNELYLRLVELRGVDWQGRRHFKALCARLMRRVLVDLARTRNAGKRRGGTPHLGLTSAEHVATVDEGDIVAVDEALEKLASLDPRKAHVVELRFFGGLTVEETAESLQVSPETVMRDWAMARAWLASMLGEPGVP
jgi:RNA polymerase sigma factor (TIGR02999 family)